MVFLRKSLVSVLTATLGFVALVNPANSEVAGDKLMPKESAIYFSLDADVLPQAQLQSLTVKQLLRQPLVWNLWKSIVQEIDPELDPNAFTPDYLNGNLAFSLWGRQGQTVFGSFREFEKEREEYTDALDEVRKYAMDLGHYYEIYEELPKKERFSYEDVYSTSDYAEDAYSEEAVADPEKTEEIDEKVKLVHVAPPNFKELGLSGYKLKVYLKPTHYALVLKHPRYNYALDGTTSKKYTGKYNHEYEYFEEDSPISPWGYFAYPFDFCFIAELDRPEEFTQLWSRINTQKGEKPSGLEGKVEGNKFYVGTEEGLNQVANVTAGKSTALRESVEFQTFLKSCQGGYGELFSQSSALCSPEELKEFFSLTLNDSSEVSHSERESLLAFLSSAEWAGLTFHLGDNLHYQTEGRLQFKDNVFASAAALAQKNQNDWKLMGEMDVHSNTVLGVNLKNGAVLFDSLGKHLGLAGGSDTLLQLETVGDLLGYPLFEALDSGGGYLVYSTDFADQLAALFSSITDRIGYEEDAGPAEQALRYARMFPGSLFIGNVADFDEEDYFRNTLSPSGIALQTPFPTEVKGWMTQGREIGFAENAKTTGLALGGSWRILDNYFSKSSKKLSEEFYFGALRKQSKGYNIAVMFTPRQAAGVLVAGFTDLFLGREFSGYVDTFVQNLPVGAIALSFDKSGLSFTSINTMGLAGSAQD